MEVNISKELSELVPNLKIGIIQYHNINVGESPQMLKGRLQLFQESIFFDLENKQINDFDGIREWRSIFKETGKDPNRYRHSAEALYRRIKKQNYLHTVHSATDLNNFFSLQYQVPIGIYDLDKISGSVTIRIGKEQEEYLGLNGRTNSLHNLIISEDNISPYGSPFVDSERTAVTIETKNALQIIYLNPKVDCVENDKLTESLMNMFIQIHGGDAHYHVMGC